MWKHFIVLLLLTSTWMVFGVSVIDSGKRNDFSKINDDLDNNDIDVNQDDCSNLTPELIEEIQSHQSVVDNIVHAIVNGKYSGDTWNA